MGLNIQQVRKFVEKNPQRFLDEEQKLNLLAKAEMKALDSGVSGYLPSAHLTQIFGAEMTVDMELGR